MKQSRISTNIIMLYLVSFTQLALPLVTLPYLTRVLSVDDYGVVSYVKSITVYIIAIIEFGYLLSGTRDVVKAKEDKKQLGIIIGRITMAKLILSFAAFLILLMMIVLIPLLRRHSLFTILSFGTPFLSIFLFDYLFRGLEKMQIITYRFLIMKGISTALTFLVIKGDAQLLFIPILDILGSLVATLWIKAEIRKMGIHFQWDKWQNVWQSLRISFVYFISNIASTAFGALNTLIVGIYLTTKDVAYWGLIMALIGAVQSMYTPISDGIYPRMLKQKSLHLLNKILLFFIPLLIIGALFTYFGAHLIMLLLGGDKYGVAANYLQLCIPLLVISFFGVIFGWPALGAIDKVKETTNTTIIAAIVQVVGLGGLIIGNVFSLTLLIIVRTLSEGVMVVLRVSYLYRFRYLFMHKV